MRRRALGRPDSTRATYMMDTVASTRSDDYVWSHDYVQDRSHPIRGLWQTRPRRTKHLNPSITPASGHSLIRFFFFFFLKKKKELFWQKTVHKTCFSCNTTCDSDLLQELPQQGGGPIPLPKNVSGRRSSVWIGNSALKEAEDSSLWVESLIYTSRKKRIGLNVC